MLLAKYMGMTSARMSRLVRARARTVLVPVLSINRLRNGSIVSLVGKE